MSPSHYLFFISDLTKSSFVRQGGLSKTTTKQCKPTLEALEEPSPTTTTATTSTTTTTTKLANAPWRLWRNQVQQKQQQQQQQQQQRPNNANAPWRLWRNRVRRSRHQVLDVLVVETNIAAGKRYQYFFYYFLDGCD